MPRLVPKVFQTAHKPLAQPVVGGGAQEPMVMPEDEGWCEPCPAKRGVQKEPQKILGYPEQCDRDASTRVSARQDQRQKNANGKWKNSATKLATKLKI